MTLVDLLVFLVVVCLLLYLVQLVCGLLKAPQALQVIATIIVILIALAWLIGGRTFDVHIGRVR